MRIFPFIFIKNCKAKTFRYRLTRQMSGEAIPAEVTTGQVLGDPNFLQFSPSWPPHEEAELRAATARSMRVLPDFVTAAEEAALLAELEPYLRRMRYEFDHWDNAIQGYRETERRAWSAPNEAVLQRVRDVAFRGARPPLQPLPHVHVLDLAPAGHIKPHVDAVRFCGAVIAGLCLASSAVMRLQHTRAAHLTLDALLQRRALYIMSDVSRYEFTHAVLGAEGSVWRGERVPRARRLALICRSAPEPRADRDQQDQDPRPH